MGCSMTQSVRDTRPWTPGQSSLPGGITGFLDRAACAFAAAGLVLLAAILVVQVGARYIVGRPTVWSEEAAVGLFVWVAMVSIALGARRGEHLTLDVISRFLPRRASHVLAVVLCLATVATFAILGWYCIKLLGPADRQVLAGIEAGLGIPARVSWIYLAVPVGFSLAIIFSVERLVLVLQDRVAVLNADVDSAVLAEIDREVEAEEARTLGEPDPREAISSGGTSEEGGL